MLCVDRVSMGAFVVDEWSWKVEEEGVLIRCVSAKIRVSVRVSVEVRASVTCSDSGGHFIRRQRALGPSGRPWL